MKQNNKPQSLIRISFIVTLQHLTTNEYPTEQEIDQAIEKTDSQQYFLEALGAYYIIFTEFWRCASFKESEVSDLLKETK